jgi:hypothetical protein
VPYIEPGIPHYHVFGTTLHGQTWVALVLAAPNTSWARGEAAVVALDVDGTARQDVVLAGGDEPVERPHPHIDGERDRAAKLDDERGVAGREKAREVRHALSSRCRPGVSKADE